MTPHRVVGHSSPVALEKARRIFRRKVVPVADWSGIVVPELERLDQFALGLTIAEVKELHGLDEIVKLSWNENLFGPLPGVLEAIHAELENIWLYPEQPYIDFRNEVAAVSGTSATNVRAGARQPRAARPRGEPCSCDRATTSSCRS